MKILSRTIRASGFLAIGVAAALVLLPPAAPGPRPASTASMQGTNAGASRPRPARSAPRTAAPSTSGATRRTPTSEASRPGRCPSTRGRP